MGAKALGSIVGTVQSTGGVDVNTEKKTTTGRRVKVKKRIAVASRAACSKQAVQPSVAEQQIAEVERTFTDRWEW